MRISDWSSDVCSSDLHDADDGVVRGRIGELLMGGFVRLRKDDGGDDLVLRQRCLEHAGEEVVGGKLALAGVHRGAEADEARRVVGRRIVVGNRAADGAAVAHLRVADAVGEVGQRGDLRPHRGVAGDGAWVVMAPMTSLPPSSRMPFRSLMPPRSTRSEGLARRCFRVGMRVMPPAMNLPSLAPASALTASSTEAGRWCVKSYMLGTPLIPLPGRAGWRGARPSPASPACPSRGCRARR